MARKKMKSITNSQESSNPEGLKQPKSPSSSDMKQTEFLGSSDLKQSDSDDQVMESSSKKSSSSTATTMAEPFTTGPKHLLNLQTLKSSRSSILHFYGQRFIEKVNRKKRSLMDSDVKTKYKQEFLTSPNTNPSHVEEN